MKCVLVSQSCLTHCNPINCSSSGSSVHGNLQARILEWGATPFSWGSSQGLNRGLLHCRQKKGYPLQYSGLEISMDCRVQEVAKSRTQLSDFHFHFCRKPTVFPLSTCFSGQHRRRIPKAIPLFYDFTWLTIWTTASPLWDGVEFFP